MVEYPKEFSHRLADELIEAPSDAVWPIAISDYYVLRRQIERCR